jgi:TolA-binding protein
MTRGFSKLAVPLALLASGPAWAGMTCDDIMNMVDHHVPSSVVVDTIASSGTTFSDADIQCLKQRGAYPDVIAKAVELKKAAPAPATTTSAPSETEEREERFQSAQGIPDDPLAESGDDEGGSAEGELGAAIRDYKAKKYRTASYTLYKLLEENAYPEKDSTIKYYLAKCLEALEMPHSAQHFYMEVVKKGPRNPLFKHALPRLARIAELTGNDYELLRIVGKIAPEAYPRQARPHLYYLMGRKSYEADELSDAVAYFEKVPANHELFPRAQYYQGIINYERDKLKSAAKAFREVIKADVPTEDPDVVKELEDLKDLSLINIARIYYGLQKFDNADKYYAKVDRDSAYWPQSLFERAWSNFFLGDLNESLGLLMTVDSPFFAESDFIPDTQYLRALIYFQLCEYPEVERIIKLYQAKYQPIRAEMQGFIKPFLAEERPLFDRAYDAYFGPKAKASSKIPVAAFRKMLRNRDLYALVREMERMDAEVTSIGAQTPQWRDSVGKYLSDAIAADQQRYKERAGRFLLQEMQSQYQSIDELLDDSDVLLFELADAQHKDYMYKSTNPTASATDLAPIDFATSPDIIYWPFNGEFWLDELASYRFTERGSCK